MLRLLEDAHVLVHPGYFFDFADEAFLVVSLLPDPSAFDEGVRRVLLPIAAEAAPDAAARRSDAAAVLRGLDLELGDRRAAGSRAARALDGVGAASTA